MMRATQDISAQSLPGIAYRTRDDATPEAELSTLAAIYKLCLESRAKKEPAPESRPNDAERIPSDSAKTIIPN
jgi:hypothetical protein